MANIYKITHDTKHRDFSVEKVTHIPYPFNRNLPMKVLLAEHIIVVYVVATQTHEADAVGQFILDNYLLYPDIPYPTMEDVCQ